MGDSLPIKRSQRKNDHSLAGSSHQPCYCCSKAVLWWPAVSYCCTASTAYVCCGSMWDEEIVLPTSKTKLSTFQTFCPVGVQFGQTVVHFAHFQVQARKGSVLGWGWGVLCSYIFPRGVCDGWVKKRVFLGKMRPHLGKTRPMWAICTKNWQNCSRIGGKNSIIIVGLEGHEEPLKHMIYFTFFKSIYSFFLYLSAMKEMVKRRRNHHRDEP